MTDKKRSHLWADIAWWLGIIVIGFTMNLPVFVIGLVLMLTGIWIQVRYRR